MRLDVFRSLWGWRGSRADCLAAVRESGAVGVEARLPFDAAGRAGLKDWLRGEELDYIAIAFTGGDVVPDPAWSPERHLQRLDAALSLAGELEPRFVNVLAGCDRWPLAQQVDFFGRAQEMAATRGVAVVFETHRASSLYSPWITLELARELPQLRYTLDLSHWVVVCERLLDATRDRDDLAPILGRVHHIQARVGYAQGPQVPHPAAPEYARELAFHRHVWETVWRAQRASGLAVTTLTPEFGPDGYLHHLPFTDVPVADLQSLNTWMARAERAHFERWLGGRSGTEPAAD